MRPLWHTLPILLMALPWARAGFNVGIKVDSNDAINYLYEHAFGTGAYTVGDEKAAVLDIKPSVNVRRLSDEGFDWGMKLKLRTQVGFHLFKLLEEGKFEDDTVQTFSFIPKAEFPIRFHDPWRITPYVQAGGGTDFDSGEVVMTSLFGAVLQFPRGEDTYIPRLDLDIQRGQTHTQQALADDSYAKISLTADIEHRFGRTAAKRRPTLIPYGKVGYHFDAMEFYNPNDDSTIKIREEYELGVRLTTTPRLRVWKWKIPRLSLGYRFGGGVQAIRLKLGG